MVKMILPDKLKKLVDRLPIVRKLTSYARRFSMMPECPPKPYPGCEKYWENRYSSGNHSGEGSRGKLAVFKAEVINAFIVEKNVKSVIEFGCGDGNQLLLAKYPEYIGFDISKAAIEKCKKLFTLDPSKTFGLMCDYTGQRADLALSLDTVYHLVDDAVYEDYMQKLFAAAIRYVIVYSSDTADNSGYEGTYTKHRKFTGWIRENFPGSALLKYIPNKYPYDGDYKNSSWSNFYIYMKKAKAHV